MAELCGDAEVYLQAGNSAGKTTGAAAIVVALARGVEALDGVRLPQLRLPIVAWVVSVSYKQQVDSSQKAYLRWIGDWPHHKVYVSGSGKNYLEALYVATGMCRHRTGESCPTCSRIAFHVEESVSALGGRVDVIHGDEPIAQRAWNECRARKQAGRPLVMLLTATPLDQSRWLWLRKDFKGCLDKIHNGRINIRCSIYDNKFLGADDIAYFEAKFSTDAQRDARLRGDYVDVGNFCPFSFTVLQKWQRSARRGYLREMNLGTTTVEVETFYDPEPDELYYVPLDPAAGVHDPTGRHDPAGLWVVSRRRPRLCARLVAYLPSFELGACGRQIATLYNRAQVVPEVTGGYGEAVLLGLRPYTNVYLEEHHDKVTGSTYTKFGWRTTSISRNTLVAALQRVISEDSIRVESLEAIESLMGVTVGPDGRIAAIPGRHDEDMIGLGIAAHLLETEPVPRHSVAYGPAVPTIDDLISADCHTPTQRSPVGPGHSERWR